MKGKSILVSTLMILMSTVTMWAAGAQDVEFPDPEMVITVVVPYSAGGGTDLAFRPLVEEMNKLTESAVVISNMGGAGSSVGTNEVLSLEADGYTILASGTHTIGATMQGLTEGYEQLDGLAGLNWDPFIIAVHVDKPWMSMEDLVNDAKSREGEISLGNAGMGGATGVASIGLNLAMDKSFNVTPFNGGKDLRAAVLGGHCDVGIFSQSEILSNKDLLRPLVVLYQERSTLDALSSIPTLDEAGFPGISIPAGSFKSMSVKTGVSDEVKGKLVALIQEAFNSDSYQSFMAEKGLISAYSTLGDYEDYENTIIDEYFPIIVEAGLYKKD